jgi:multiple sugar transport system ATP-binding protein
MTLDFWGGTMASVELKNLKKAYGDVEVIRGIDMQIAYGEFCVFVGPSGCGKSTLLRMISGLEPITSGEIEIEARWSTHPRRRPRAWPWCSSPTRSTRI